MTKRLLLICFLFAQVCTAQDMLLPLPVDATAPPPVTDASDAFTRADNTSLGANWTEGASADLQVKSNQIYAATIDVHGLAAYTGITWPDSQGAVITITTISAGGNFGPAVRVSSAADDGYVLHLNGANTTVYLGRMDNGSWTYLAEDAEVLATGDSLKLVAKGNKLYGYHNTTLLTGINGVTDATYSSGYAGIHSYSRYGYGDNWRGFKP